MIKTKVTNFMGYCKPFSIGTLITIDIDRSVLKIRCAISISNVHANRADDGAPNCEAPLINYINSRSGIPLELKLGRLLKGAFPE